MTQEKTTMHQLEQDLVDELNSNKKEILENQYPEDAIRELADSYVPIYNYDLIEALSCDHTLAYVDDNGLLPEILAFMTLLEWLYMKINKCSSYLVR